MILIWDSDLWLFGLLVTHTQTHTHHVSHFFHCSSRSLWLSRAVFWQVQSQTIFMRSDFPRSHLLSTMKSLKHEEYIISSQTCMFFGSAPSLSHESGIPAQLVEMAQKLKDRYFGKSEITMFFGSLKSRFRCLVNSVKGSKCLVNEAMHTACIQNTRLQ